MSSINPEAVVAKVWVDHVKCPDCKYLSYESGPKQRTYELCDILKARRPEDCHLCPGFEAEYRDLQAEERGLL